MADANALDRGVGVQVPPEPGHPVTPPPSAPATPDDGKVMSLVDHLSELRSRIVRIVLAVLGGSLVGFYFSTSIRNFLLAPLGRPVQVLGLGDAFVIQLKISIVVGIILAMPVILYQLWAFIAPGLTPQERRTVRPWVPLALTFFAMGVVIAYVVLPFAIQFLLQFTDQVLVAQIAAGPYFDFVTTMFLAFGLVLEFPILLYGLSLVGVVSSARLSQWRRTAILGIAIFAAAATPGGDLVSPTVLGGTMYILYELTIRLIRRSGR